MAPTLSVLLADIKGRFRRVQTSDDRKEYINLLCGVSRFTGVTSVFTAELSENEVTEFFERILNSRARFGLNENEEIIDSIINYYNDGKFPVRFGNLKHRANAVEKRNARLAEEEINRKIRTLTTRK